jgi:hypothetical protein
LCSYKEQEVLFIDELGAQNAVKGTKYATELFKNFSMKFRYYAEQFMKS